MRHHAKAVKRGAIRGVHLDPLGRQRDDYNLDGLTDGLLPPKLLPAVVLQALSPARLVLGDFSTASLLPAPRHLTTAWIIPSAWGPSCHPTLKSRHTQGREVQARFSVTPCQAINAISGEKARG